MSKHYKPAFIPSNHWSVAALNRWFENHKEGASAVLEGVESIRFHADGTLGYRVSELYLGNMYEYTVTLDDLKPYQRPQ